MDPKKKAFTAAVAGTAIGIAGLAIIAAPASAGAAPALPTVSADDLVTSVSTAKAPALDGTVTVQNNLGLPNLNMVPGASALNFDSAHVYNDGNGRSKVSAQQGTTEQTIIHDGTTVWNYNSKNNTATKSTVPAGNAGDHSDGKITDPTTAATELLAKVRQTSTVAVDGTATVAGRPAYELVLSPKPTERTLLREIRVAVDSETRLPLRLEVLTNGTTAPALQMGFTEIRFAQQPASEFQFTPPQGAKVTDGQPKPDAAALGQLDQAEQSTKVVGDGWDTVLTGKIPADVLSGKQPAGSKPSGVQGQAFDPKELLSQLGKPASGTWGSGYVITTKVGTAVITADGRFAAGAVPEQVLFQALGAK
jgi:outer membrane lipoprotein-sorting protein